MQRLFSGSSTKESREIADTILAAIKALENTVNIGNQNEQRESANQTIEINRIIKLIDDALAKKFDLETKGSNGSTILRAAVCKGSLMLVNYLLSRKTNVDTASIQDALFWRQWSIVKALLWQRSHDWMLQKKDYYVYYDRYDLLPYACDIGFTLSEANKLADIVNETRDIIERTFNRRGLRVDKIDVYLVHVQRKYTFRGFLTNIIISAFYIPNDAVITDSVEKCDVEIAIRKNSNDIVAIIDKYIITNCSTKYQTFKNEFIVKFGRALCDLFVLAVDQLNITAVQHFLQLGIMQLLKSQRKIDYTGWSGKVELELITKPGLSQEQLKDAYFIIELLIEAKLDECKRHSSLYEEHLMEYEEHLVELLTSNLPDEILKRMMHYSINYASSTLERGQLFIFNMFFYTPSDLSLRISTASKQLRCLKLLLNLPNAYSILKSVDMETLQYTSLILDNPDIVAKIDEVRRYGASDILAGNAMRTVHRLFHDRSSYLSLLPRDLRESTLTNCIYGRRVSNGG